MEAHWRANVDVRLQRVERHVLARAARLEFNVVEARQREGQLQLVNGGAVEPQLRNLAPLRLGRLQALVVDSQSVAAYQGRSGEDRAALSQQVAKFAQRRRQHGIQQLQL